MSYIRKNKNDRLDLLFTMALIARHGNAVTPKKTKKHKTRKNCVCTFARVHRDSSHEFSEPNHEYRKYSQYPLCRGNNLRDSAQGRTLNRR